MQVSWTAYFQSMVRLILDIIVLREGKVTNTHKYNHCVAISTIWGILCYRYLWWFNISKSSLKWCREICWNLSLPLQWCCMGGYLVRFDIHFLFQSCIFSWFTKSMIILGFASRGLISFTFLCGSIYLGLVILSWGISYHLIAFFSPFIIWFN